MQGQSEDRPLFVLWPVDLPAFCGRQPSVLIPMSAQPARVSATAIARSVLHCGQPGGRAKRSGVEVDAVHPAILAVTQNVQFCEIGAHFGRKRHDLVDF